MSVSIIVTTYNRPAALTKVLNGLAHQTCAVDEVIVADDGSDQETARAIKKIGTAVPYPLVHVWHEDQGFRAAKIRNDAVRQSSGEYIVLLDGDCIPNRHFVKDHIRLARRGSFFQGKRVLVEKAAAGAFEWQHANSPQTLMKYMLSGSLGNPHHLLRCSWYPLLTSPGLSGTRSCNMGLFKSDLFAVNGFNEDFVGWGREDSELVARLYRYGLRRNVHPFMAICFHLWHAENSREELARNDELLRKALLSNDYYAPRGLAKRS
ncbi:MAG: glycosyltransferase family 2 protein [Deltaproteobacteria bacterium]|nr:glycosyltransferase family 2 protein [Deltaproteobacteria bacterium]